MTEPMTDEPALWGHPVVRELLAEVDRLRDRVAELENALNAARDFIEDEFGSAEAQAWGEFLSREARPVHKTIVDALCSVEPKS